MGIDIVPCDATLGATVTGVTLSRLDDDGWATLLDAFHTHGVLIFPGLHPTHDEQVALSKRLGPLEPVGRTVGGGEPDIVRISNLDADGNINTDPASPSMRLVIGNMDWHADSSFRVPPARSSMLSCHVASSSGGETEFADLYAAYDMLDDATKADYETRTITHSYVYSQGAVGGLDSVNFTPEQRASLGPTERPLIDVHPATGRRALCIGRHAYRISGMTDDDAQALIAHLLDEVCRPPRTVTHTWQVGDLVWWDNRCVLHRARPWDYTEPRVMWHTRIAGDVAQGISRSAAV